MELFLLPLLLLGVLLTTLDGGGGTDEADSDNDTLEGSGTDRVVGGAGDDLISLNDDAVGLGGAGSDTISAADNAHGYGRDGDDRLSAEDHAMIQGGAGDDVLVAADQARAYGAAGDDTLTASGEAVIQGGAGNDMLALSDHSEGFGGTGDDQMIASTAHTTLTGGAGNDIFATDWRDADYVTTRITDFVAGQDQLAVLIGNRDVDALRFTVWQPEGTADTMVRIDAGGDPEDTPMTIFQLQGVSDFDLNDVVLYQTDLSAPLDWAPDPAWTETLTGGAGADSLSLHDSQVGFGAGGDDTLIARDEALADGGAGADSLTGYNHTTLHGGEGNDSLTAHFSAEAHGDAGDDTMLSFGDPQYYTQPSLYGGDGNDRLAGDGDLYGGAGNDLIEPDADGALFNGVDSYSGDAYGGAGDDTIQGGLPGGGMMGSVAFHGGAGNDEMSADGQTSLYGDDGDDVIVGKGTLEGGAGNDRLELSYERNTSTDQSSGQADGGAGNDTIIASSGGGANGLYTTSGSMAIKGGAGDDLLFMDLQRADSIGPGVVHGTPSHMTGGAGADRFVMTGFPLEINHGSADDERFLYSGPVVIEDFNPAEDSLGLVVSAADIQGASLSISYAPQTDTTTITISQGRTIDGDFHSVTLANIALKGVTSFDPQDLKFYADDGLTPLNVPLQGGAGNDVLTALLPTPASVMHGAAGDNTLSMREGAIYGEDGDDSLSGNGTLHGGAGDDDLTVGVELVRSINHAEWVGHGQAYGGDGDDRIEATVVIGEDDKFSATGSLIVQGGAGNDVITSSNAYAIDAGLGDDTVMMVNGASTGSGGPLTLGDGDDLLVAMAGEYPNFIDVADFNPADDRLAVIAPTSTAGRPVNVTWDAAAGATTIEMEDYFSFTLQGVNGIATPIGIRFYASEADLQANQPYRTA